MAEQKNYALIVAGGSGSRMNATVPKQFLLLNDKPVLMHTIERFHEYDNAIEIIVVLPEAQFELWESLCHEYKFSIRHQLVAGGSVRFESVKNGLSRIQGDGIVAIHDGVRPLVSFEAIGHCFEVARLKGNAIPVMPVIESLRIIDGENSKAVDRSSFVTIQTPQVFNVSEIKAAYNQPFNEAFTDDASVLEAAGLAINLVQGNIENIKITHPADLIFAGLLIKNRNL
ncbi:MAG: 2-C-methyl-D-erythritol 4-phosphate cytidylyltransferase [Bacteroidales bacterium]|nr:2-C-methyl-D-erythritol 4-phosphate cytidylyltransferase [Bacteroidales bacterium]